MAKDNDTDTCMNVKHGSPHDRGSADAYYGRPPIPHKWLDPIGRRRVLVTDATEVQEYWIGYRDETDRKDWGDTENEESEDY